MPPEENKAMGRRVIEEVVNKGNMAVVDEIMASNFVYHDYPREIKGTEEFKRFITMWRNAFPDLHCTIEDIIAEGETVACRYRMRGTFKHQLFNFAPTGKQLNLVEADFVYFENGKQVDCWPHVDLLMMFRQLGIPIPDK
jgi:steroid delta-isomerase-like uncharacterized protein